MSYLNTPTIIFSGDFQSDVSTVNNDVRHYENQSFEKRFQDNPVYVPQPQGPRKEIENGWWNPNGGATFNFVGCKVVRCLNRQGQEETQSNLIGAEVSGPKNRASGKMVDLDPQMQMTSELWGVRLRISDASGVLLLEGDLHATGFRDLQQRQFDPVTNKGVKGVNGQGLGANYVSTLENVIWNEDLSNFALLDDLKNLTEDNKLSISLDVFGYYYAHADGRFSLGKVLGAIGPWKKTEPIRFAATRRLYGTTNSAIAYSNFVIERNILRLDLGMSLPVQDPLGTVHPAFTKSIYIAVSKNTPISSDDMVSDLELNSYEIISPLTIPDDPEWLLNTGGIIQIELTAEQLDLLNNNQLLLIKKSGGLSYLYSRESVDGLYLRADQNVLRIDTGESWNCDFYLYSWGNPVKGKTVTVILQDKQSGGGTGSPDALDQPTAAVPDINFPASAMTVHPIAETDENGKTTITFSGSDPGNPRGYIEGQLYFFDYTIDHIKLDQYFNDAVLIHLRNQFDVPEKPVWDDIKEAMIQFGNLYPAMSKHVVDLSDPEALIRKKEILKFAFTRDINDPLYMPVTRDLPKSKIEAILKWLDNPSMESSTVKIARAAKQPEDITVNEALSSSKNLMADITRSKGGANIIFNLLPDNSL